MGHGVVAVPLLFNGRFKMSITVKDVADMVERVDEKLSPLTRYDGFQPYEGIYRLGDWGYVTGNRI